MEKDQYVRRIRFSIICLCIIAICILNGLHNLYNANFIPMDGTYQNYNPWRRVMAGEVPFRDFVSLYGLGQIYTGAFLTFLFGGSYAASMVVADFLSLFCAALLLFSIKYMISRSPLKSIYTTLILTSLIAVVPTSLYAKMPTVVAEMIQTFLNNNNARMLRAAIVSIVPLMGMIITRKWIHRHPSATQKDFDIAFSRICGGTAVSGILWENCMGISICVAISLMWFLVITCRYYKKCKIMCLLILNYCVTGMLCFAVLLLVLTRSGVLNYIRNTFSMGGGFFWYTNNGPKIIHISDIDVNKWIVAGIVLIAIFVYRMLKSDDKTSQISNMYAAAIMFCAVFANYIYNWSSGGSRRDVLTPAIVGSVCALTFGFINKAISEKITAEGVKKIYRIYSVGTVLVFSGCLFFICRLTYNAISLTKEGGIFFDGLGGYIDISPRSGTEASAKDVEIGIDTVKNESLWSTFSTAVDVLVDTTNPSGFDYMEYALGQSQQDLYLNLFQNTNPTFVQTMNPEYNPWDVWDKGQNAYFWEELYMRYVPYTRNSTSIYWRKVVDGNAEFQPKIELNVSKVNSSQALITVSTDIKSPFVVFLRVEYACDKEKHLSTGLLHKMVQVDDISYRSLHRDIDNMQFGWYLPQEGTRVLPVTVYDGEGQIKLSVYQAEEVTLNIINIDVGNSYRTPYKYIFCDDVNEDGFMHGVNEGTSQVSLPDTYYNRIMINSVESIKANDGTEFPVSKVEDEDGVLILTLINEENKMEKLQYPNFFEIITSE